MENLTRIRLFLTEYRAICEKYNLHFEEGLIEGSPNSVRNPMHSTMVIRDDDPDKPDVYFIATNTGATVEAYSLDDEDELIKPYDNIPEFCGRHEKSDEEVEAELRAMGLM